MVTTFTDTIMYHEAQRNNQGLIVSDYENRSISLAQVTKWCLSFFINGSDDFSSVWCLAITYTHADDCQLDPQEGINLSELLSKYTIDSTKFI